MQAKKEQPEKSCGAALFPPAWDFGEWEAGYEPVDPVCFVVQNTGSAPLRNLSVSMEEQALEKCWLCLAHTRDTLGCAGSRDSETRFYVYPRDGLERGEHTAGIRVQADDLVTLHVPLRFTVRPRFQADPDLFADDTIL